MKQELIPSIDTFCSLKKEKEKKSQFTFEVGIFVGAFPLLSSGTILPFTIQRVAEPPEVAIIWTFLEHVC